MNRVLIVDDAPELLSLLRALLEADGYEVDEAGDGAEALRKARHHPPILIVSDLLMPVMDGYTLLRHWKADEQLRKIPFVVYTATYTEPNDRELAVNLGADAFIVKSTGVAAFLAGLREVLVNRGRGDSTPARQPRADENVLLKEYNQVLIHKLEGKAFQLEQANRELRDNVNDAVEARRCLEGANLELLKEVEERRKAEAGEAMRSRAMTLLAGGASLDDILDGLVRGVEAAHPGMLASVLLLDAAGTHLLTGAAPSLPASFSHAIHGAAIGPAAGSCGTAAFTGQRVVVADIQTDPLWADYRELAAQAGLAACWSEPIRGSNGQVLGAFALYHRQAHAPDADEIGAIAAGALLAVVAIERTRAQEALRTSTNLLEISQSIAKLGGWEFNVATRSMFLTAEAYRLHDSSPEEFHPTAEVALGFYLPESRQIMAAAFQAATKHGQGFDLELELLTLKGRRIDVRTTCMVTLQDGRPVKLTGALQDITERKRAEEARRESELRLASIIDSAMDAIITVDAAQRILVFNAAAGAMFRCNPADVIGQPIEQFLPQQFRARHADQMREFGANRTITRRTMGQTGPIMALRANGEEFPVEASISHVEVQRQPIFSVILRDISERFTAEAAKAGLEAQLHEAQKMEALGTLASGIAHDFNNILGAILGNVALAREEVGTPHSARESLDEIAKAGLRAKSLVDQILTFARKQTPELTNQPLQPLLDEAIKLLRATVPASVQFELALTAASVRARVSASQMSQVLINLCTNAWHAMKDGTGHISLTLDEVQFEQAPGQYADALPPGRYARIQVRDDGAGMDAATQARVFEPFFTTKPVGSGTGLGLAVVHGIVKAHHGAITVTSAPGEGCVFEVLLPATDAPAESALAAVAPSPLLHGGGRHVLYLDDDKAMVFMVTRMLIRRGFRVSAFLEAEEALAAVRAAPGDFDLVVTDFNMPKASGLDVARAIAAIRPGLPVVITSGYITDELRADAREAGVRHLVYKPNSIDELADAIGQVLECRPVPDA